MAVAAPSVVCVVGAATVEGWGLELGTDCVEVLLTDCMAGARGVTFGGGASVLSTLFSCRGAPEAMDPRGCVKDLAVTKLGLETVAISSVTVGWVKL